LKKDFNASVNCLCIEYLFKSFEATVARHTHMPIPVAVPLLNLPTHKTHNNMTNLSADAKANKELLLRGLLCTRIGSGVLLSPYLINSTGVQEIVAKSSLVGWFALALGIAFIGLYLRRRLRNRPRQSQSARPQAAMAWALPTIKRSGAT
jgi:hypothetical protein